MIAQAETDKTDLRGGEGMEVIIRGAPNEIAALVRATQDRRTKQVEIQFDGAINRLAKVLRQAKDDTVPEVPEK